MNTYGATNITYGSTGAGSDDLATTWLQRIQQNTDGYYKKWESRYKCRKLEQYYSGRQWEATGTGYEPYVTNLIFSTIETKIPSLMFDDPIFHVAPQPISVEYDFEAAIKRATLREDIINTLFAGNKDDYGQNIELACLDAFFRFGIIEVGYSADWIDNPNADMPILRSDGTPYYDENNNVIKQPKELSSGEKVYVKRILAERFRVSGLQVGPDLQQANWCAYWDYVRIEDILADKTLKNRDKLNWAGQRSSDFVDEDLGFEVNSSMRSGDLVRVWKIWDNRSKKRLLIADPQGVTLKEKPFNRLPLFGLRFHPVQKGWLPMPPVFNWKPPQDEYNEAREQLRNHRKRYVRKFIYAKSAFMEEEVDKLINGGDGTFVGTNNTGDVSLSVKPIDNASLGSESQASLIVSKDDFNVVSGTSSEERGKADRTTATQANITNQKSQIRESRGRVQIASWLAKIATEVLLQAEENFTSPVWIKMVIPQEAVGRAMEEIPYIWHQVNLEDLSEGENGVNFHIHTSVDALSPLQGAQDQQAWITFVSMLQQFPALSMDPILIRECAFRVGYRNEQVIKRMQAAAQMMLAQKFGQQQGQPGGGNMGSQTIQNLQSPDVNSIQNQLTNQLGNAIPVTK